MSGVLMTAQSGPNNPPADPTPTTSAERAELVRLRAFAEHVRELADNMVKHDKRWYREATGNFGKLLLAALAALDERDEAATTREGEPSE